VAIICPRPLTYARQIKTYLNYMHASELTQPATRVDTTYWQLFRPDINTAHFYFLLQKLCQVIWLLTGWKNFFYTSGGPLRPEARGICHICHMVNPALFKLRMSATLLNDYGMVRGLVVLVRARMTCPSHSGGKTFDPPYGYAIMHTRWLWYLAYASNVQWWVAETPDRRRQL